MFNRFHLKGSYDVAKNNMILCIWCNPRCLCGLRLKKHELMNALAGSVTEEKNILNKVNILFSFLSKMFLSLR